MRTKVKQNHDTHNEFACAKCGKLFTTRYELNEDDICLDCEMKQYRAESSYNTFMYNSLAGVFSRF